MTYYLNWDLRHESQPALKKKSKHEIKLSKDEILALVYALWGTYETEHGLCNLKKLDLESHKIANLPYGCPEQKANRKKREFLHDIAFKLEKFVVENH